MNADIEMSMVEIDSEDDGCCEPSGRYQHASLAAVVNHALTEHPVYSKIILE